MDLEYIEQQAESTETPPRNFATIAAVYEDGVTLLFDGEEEPSAKHYKVNTSVYFRVNDRVRIFEDSGTYVVEYVVGAPMPNPIVGIPPDGANGTVLTKQSAADFDAGWNTPYYVPTSGTTGHVLTKTANGYAFQAPSGGLPSGGSTGQIVRKTATGAAWLDETTELPSGGSAGQVLKKTSSASEWGDYTPSGVLNGGASGLIQLSISGTRLMFRNGTSGTWQTLARLDDIH